MKAAAIHRFGPPDVIALDDLPRPTPDPGQVLIRVAAAGVGPWDALIREQKSVVNVPLPITLGSDLSGIVESVGIDVRHFQPGDKDLQPRPIRSSLELMLNMLWHLRT